MKFKQITWEVNAQDSGRVDPAETTETTLTGTEGAESGVEQVAFSKGGLLDNVNFAAPVSVATKVISATTIAKGGTRRIMVRIDIPYQALSPDGTVSSLAQGFSPQRSGATISAHVVLTVPREAVQDLNGTNGSAVCHVAEAQLGFLISRLRAIMDASYGTDVNGNQTVKFLNFPGLLRYSADSGAGTQMVNLLNNGGAKSTAGLVTVLPSVADPNGWVRRGLVGLTPVAADATFHEMGGFIGAM